jgi:hypothetical protein
MSMGLTMPHTVARNYTVPHPHNPELSMMTCFPVLNEKTALVACPAALVPLKS